MAPAWAADRHPLRSLIASLPGLAVALMLTRMLPVVPSTLLNALLLAGGAKFSGQCLQPTRWWSLIGVMAGGLIGNAMVFAEVMQRRQAAGGLSERGGLLLILMAAGSLAGVLLDRHSLPHRRRPVELLRAASGLTAGIFAVLVTLSFLHLGLDGARSFSSRLSTSLTILVVCVSGPGWLLHQSRKRRPPSPTSVPLPTPDSHEA